MNTFGIIVLLILGFIVAGPLGVIIALAFCLGMFICTLPFRRDVSAFSWGRLETPAERAERRRRG